MTPSELAEIIDDPAAVKDYLNSSYTKTHVYRGFVKAKERPRVGRGGRVFTAPETRKFEAAVNAWAKDQFAPVIRFPIEVMLTVMEETDDAVAVSLNDVTYNTKGDVDNLAKSILDGVNGVLYKDDKQIAKLTVERKWAAEWGFVLTIARCGLTQAELSNLKKRLK